MSEQMAEGLEDLSPRLREVLLLVAEGKTNQEIGDELSIKMETARNHVHLLARRIGVSGTPENRNVRVKLIRWLLDKEIRELTGEVRILKRKNACLETGDGRRGTGELIRTEVVK